MTRYWVCRLGRGGEFINECKKGSYIAIGWGDMGELGWLSEEEIDHQDARENLKQIYRETYPKIATTMKTAVESGEIWSFIRGMKEGDRVSIPDLRRRTVHIAEVAGPYEFKEDWNDACRYSRRRSVKWIGELSKDDMSTKLRNSIGGIMTVFSIDKHKAEIEALLAGEEYVKPRPKTEISGEALLKYIVKRVRDLDAREFENFVSHLLEALGIRTATTPMTGDKGIDVVGTLVAQGLADINLYVQVKRVKGSIGIDEVQRLRGTLASGDHGAIITTGTFTKQAAEAAEDVTKMPIKLVSGEDLAELILDVYEDLDEEYKNLLGLQKKDVPIVDKYFVPGTSKLDE